MNSHRAMYDAKMKNREIKGLIEEFLDDLTYCGNYPSNDLSLKSIIDKINMKREKWKKRCRI